MIPTLTQLKTKKIETIGVTAKGTYGMKKDGKCFVFIMQ